MLKILEFVCRDFWTFVGCLILTVATMATFFEGIEKIILAIKQQPEKYD